MEVNRAGLGQSTVIGLGDDALIGVDVVDVLDAFQRDDETKAVVLIGHLNGTFEEKAAMWYKKQHKPKPVVAFIAGNAVPFGYSMGYASDIAANGYISVQDKRDALEDAGMRVVSHINDIHKVLAELK